MITAAVEKPKKGSTKSLTKPQVRSTAWLMPKATLSTWCVRKLAIWTSPFWPLTTKEIPGPKI